MSEWNKITEAAVVNNQAEFTTNKLGKYALKKSTNRLYLYNEGDECTETTGGWDGTYTRTGANYRKGERLETQLYTYSSRSGGEMDSYLGTENAIDLTDYSTMHIIVDDVYKSATQNVSNCVCIDSLAQGKSIFPRTGSLSIENTGETVYDISAFTGQHYILILSCEYYQTVRMKISKIWLE